MVTPHTSNMRLLIGISGLVLWQACMKAREAGISKSVLTCLFTADLVEQNAHSIG